MNSNPLSNSHRGPTCAAFEPLLPLAAQRLLSPDEARQLEVHSATCAHCQARLAAYERLDGALRRHFERVAPPPLHIEDIMSQIQDHEEAGASTAPAAPSARSLPGKPPAAPLPRRVRSRGRRFVALIAAIVPVLAIALITTALVASRHPTGKQLILGSSPMPGSSPTPGQQAAPSGVYFTAITSSGPNGKLILYALNPDNGSVRWQYPLVAGVDNTTPVIDHGVLYFIDQDGAEQGQAVKSNKNAVYALRASDGKELWHTPINYVADMLRVVNGVVYTGTAGGGVYALNASDGSIRWHVTVGDAANVDQVVDGVVYVDTYHVVPGVVSNVGMRGMVYALNASDGSQKWRFALHGSGSVQVSNGLVTVLDTGLMSSTQGTTTMVAIVQRFTVLNASDGSVRWRYPGAPTTLVEDFVDQDTVYMSTWSGVPVPGKKEEPATTLQALNISDGTPRWQKSFIASGFVTTHPQGVIYLTANGDTIFALNSGDGSELWRRPISHLQYEVQNINGVLYGVTQTALYAINPSDGSVQWQYPVAAGASVAGGSDHLVYGSFSSYGSQQNQGQGAIFALDTSTGKLVWHYEKARIVSAQVMVG